MIYSALTSVLPKTFAFKFGRLAQLWLLAVLVLGYSVLEMAIANSLFLTKVGAGHLPQVFILIGLGSLPSYLIFSQVVDRYSRTKLFQIAIGAALLIALGLRALIEIDAPWVYYLLMIVLFFQWDFHNTILYSSLLTDYFTATEYKKYTPTLGIGQATGILVGGTITSILPRFLSTPNLLLIVPVLMVAAIILLRWLDRSQVKVITEKKGDEVGIVEALKTFPKLAKRYPLMLFLAGSSFLLVIIYLTMEFLWFSVYEQYFTSDELTQFLGLMRIIVSLLQMLVLYCFTRPLLKWLGVSRMNVVFPITTLISLICFLFKVNLWTGIGLHLNGDGLFKSINIPVHQLNYNAIPEEFIGRIRTLSDGVFYAVGLTSVGTLLLFANSHLNLTQISWIAICLGLFFLFLRMPMGRFYGAGLEDMIRANTIDLADLPEGRILPKHQSKSLIKDWLHSPMLELQYRALDLAIEIDADHELLDSILGLSHYSDDVLRRKILDWLVTASDPQLESRLVALLNHNLVAHQVIALEGLLARQYQFTEGQLQPLLRSGVCELRVLATLALPDQTWEGAHLPYSDATGMALLRVTPYRTHPKQIGIILSWLGQGTQFAIAGLKTLTQLPEGGSSEAWRTVISYLTHADEEVRLAAYTYLASHQPKEALRTFASGFGDPAPKVRNRIATLTAQVPNGLSLAQQQIHSTDPIHRQTAIASLAQIKHKEAQETLYEHFQPEFLLLKMTRAWEQTLQHSPETLPLRLAIQDFQQRMVQQVFSVLSNMGHRSMMNAINYSIWHGHGRDRANAIEMLSSFKERRFIRPLLPILEGSSPDSAGDTPSPLDEKHLNSLAQAIESADEWIRRGASATIAQLSNAQLNEFAPDLLKAARSSQQYPMDQLLLLKKVPIFQNLTLDELDLILHELEQVSVLAQQTIYEEGSWGPYFYVIESGTIALTKQMSDRTLPLKELHSGEHFGEVCLFDDAPHWDGAIARTDATLLKLEKKKFKALLMQSPRISLEICRYLSQRLREYDHLCDLQNQTP